MRPNYALIIFSQKSLLIMKKISYFLPFALIALLASCHAHEKVPYVVDAENIERIDRLEGEVLVAMAVHIGKTRLIDNFIASVE